MTPAELEGALVEGKLRSAYLLAGAEALLRDDALAALRAAVLTPGAEDFNFERLRGEGLSPSALRDALRALPVMAEHRFVLLSEPEPRRGAGKPLLDALADEVALLGQQRETVLVVAAAKVDKRARWVKAFSAKHAALITCEAPTRARELAAFARAEAKRQKVELEPGAAELLAERVGPQLLLLRQEIAKAELLAGPGHAVTRAHVDASTGAVAEEPIWDLTDAIGEGRTSDALALLSRMRGAPAPMLLGTLATHFRKLARARTGGRVAGPPFVVKKLERQASRFTPGRLHGCLRAIHETDTALKGASALSPELAIERLVLGLSS